MTIYRFARCEVDDANRELRVSGIELAVEPKVFDLLVYLLLNREKLVSKDELIATVWKGRIVTDSAISVALNAARNAIGDSGRTQHSIKTVQKQGFRFTADVDSIVASESVNSISSSDFGPNDIARSAVSTTRSLPLIAIAPGTVELTDNNNVGHALIDDVATELARFHMLRVMAPQSTFQKAFTSLDTQSVAQQYGINYLVHVSVMSADTKCTIKVTITDTKQLSVIESANFTASHAELMCLRDETVSMLVATVSNSITEEEIRNCRSQISNQPNAYTCLLHGLSIYKLGEVSLENSRKAQVWFDRAVEIDPSCARAYAWRNCCGADLVPDVMVPDFHKHMKRELSLALELDPTDHEVHRVYGGLSCVMREHELSEYHLAKAAELNPNDSRVLLRTGFYRSFVSAQSNDLVYIDKAFNLNPHRPGYYFYDRAVALFNSENYEEAACDLKIAAMDTLGHGIYTAACQEALGEHAKAAATVNNICENFGTEIVFKLENRYPFACYAGNSREKRLFGFLKAAGFV